MIELLKTIRIVGLRPILRLYRAYRFVWEGTIDGYYTTRMIQALLNVGFFDEVQKRGRIDLDTFAKARNLDGTILKALCDSLFSLSVLKKEGSNYSLDSKGQLLVDVAHGWFEGVYGYEAVVHCLEELLTKEKEYGRDVHRRIRFVTKGYGEMEKWIYFPLAIDIISRNRFRKVLDLGCGDGTFLRALCERDNELLGYGVDIAPEAIADGREKAKQAGLQDRIQLFVEDISKVRTLPDPLRTIDAAITFFVLHELLFSGADAVIELLRGFRTAFPGVPLIVFEVVRPTPEEMRKRPGMAIYYFLYHDITHQKPVSGEEWKELFDKAGFSVIEERRLRFARTAIFTIR